jgi:hypothetical protein
MREVLIEVGTQIIFELLMLLVGVLFAYLGKLLAKTKKMEHINMAMYELESVVKNVVGEIQQTTVDGLKEASADGKLTKDEIKRLGVLLVSHTLDQLSAPASETLIAAGVDIEGMIHSIAEAWIAEIKRDK